MLFDFDRALVPLRHCLKGDQGVTLRASYKVSNVIAGGQGELSIADLMKGLGDAKSKMGPARKALLKMAKQAEPLTAPLPGPIRERQERKAGYETTKEDITKWQPLVKVKAMPTS